MDWMRKAFADRVRQPDQRSCGAAVLVVARMVNDPGYAELMVTGRHPGTGFAMAGSVDERFTAEVLAMHRRTTSPVDVRGRAQIPWPRVIGTPPWAVARQMSGSSGVTGATYDSKAVNPFDRRDALTAILHATRNGHAVPLFVGNRWTPRHVVLVLSPELDVYEPARGRPVRVTAGDFVDGKLGLGGWDKPWLMVLPVRS